MSLLPVIGTLETRVGTPILACFQTIAFRPSVQSNLGRGTTAKVPFVRFPPYLRFVSTSLPEFSASRTSQGVSPCLAVGFYSQLQRLPCVC
jgi:hypothetical protein